MWFISFRTHQEHLQDYILQLMYSSLTGISGCIKQLSTTYRTWSLNCERVLKEYYNKIIYPTCLFLSGNGGTRLLHLWNRLTLQAWIKAPSISSPLHRAGSEHLLCFGQHCFQVMRNTRRLLFCKQLAIESFRWSSPSSPCHLPPQERASRHGQRVLSKSNRELNQRITTAASAKGTS